MAYFVRLVIKSVERLPQNTVVRLTIWLDFGWISY